MTELVIKLDEETYKEVMNRTEFDTLSLGIKLIEAVQNGIQLPKGHGDLIDKEELKENIKGWYAFMKDICKQPYMTLKQEEIIGKIDVMTPIIKADKESKE